MLNSKSKGFTLIELLVVIAIIGILASIVLASLNSARGKANDATTKAELDQVRAAAELYSSSNNNNYAVAAVTSCNAGIFADATSGMKPLISALTTPSANRTADCGATGTSNTAYSVAAQYTGGAVWCVDSTGVSRGTNSTGNPYDSLVTVTGGTYPAHASVGATACN